jgi:nitrogen fixation protein NifU and related proteins
MSDLDELYQELILDHTKRPRNFRAMEDATNVADGHNRLCGDKLRLYIKIAGDRIEDVAFQGEGCSISKSSASMMTEALKGKTIREAEELFEQFHHVLTGPADDANVPDMGKLSAFAGVRRFPVRVKCATLPWHAFKAALENKQKQVSTE